MIRRSDLAALAWRAGAGLILAWWAGRLDLLWLRGATTSGLLAFARAAGIDAARQGAALFVVRGQPFEMSLGCTQIAYVAGVAPCFLDFRRTAAANAARLAAVFAGFSAANLARLAVLFALWWRGAPWAEVHDVLCGALHFLIIACAIVALDRQLAAPSVPSAQDRRPAGVNAA